MYHYWGFGLNIASEIEFPELLPSTFEIPDLTISIGITPQELVGEDVVKKVRMAASPQEYLLDVKGIARYYTSNGTNIIIQPDEGAEIKNVRLFMLSNAMASILHQQNKIPLHASGIITNDGLVLFTGASGVGKSTTAYGLMQQGYPLFTDDVCVLNYNNLTQQVEAVASYPMMKLWENTLDCFPMAESDKSYPVRSKLPKYGLFQHQQFTCQSFPVRQVFILKADNIADNHSIKKLSNIEAFNALQQNTYRRLQVDMMNLRQSHFQIISKLASQAKVFELKRSQGSADITAHIEFIKKLLADNAKA